MGKALHLLAIFYGHKWTSSVQKQFKKRYQKPSKTRSIFFTRTRYPL